MAGSRGTLARWESSSLNGADQPIVIKNVDALVLGLGQIGRGAYLASQRATP